jgi:PucR family transcriptional regulator, purine catabolism regulatory protein
MDGIPVYMASGDSCDNIERINVAYLEAWETIDIGKKLYNNDLPSLIPDMAPYHLVKNFLTSTGNTKLYARIYEPLMKYDREKGGELIQTLETYLECNFSRTKTAEKLHLHRNSLNYRLQKIEELLEQDIDHLDTFSLLLASISRRLSL